MVVPFMTLYLVSAHGFSVVTAGDVVAGFGAGAVVAPLVGGALADHLGRRVTLLGSTLTTSAIMVGLAYARPAALIVVLVLTLGMTLEAPRPVAQALVADLVAEDDRVRAYAALFWMGNLGFAVAMASAGFLAQTGRLGRCDPGRVWAAGVALVGVGFALTAVASTTTGYLLSVAVWTIGEILPASVSAAIVTRLAPEELRGRYSGLHGFALASGWLTSSIGGTRLLSVSPLLLWGTCATLSAVSAFRVHRLAPKLRPPDLEPQKCGTPAIAGAP